MYNETKGPFGKERLFIKLYNHDIYEQYNTIKYLIFSFFVCYRTKWKRQTAVGLELLAEAGNYAAFQRLYGGPPYGCWPYPGAGGSADLYYRQAAVAAAAVSTLQKPLAYRLYPGVAGPSHLPPPPATAAPYYHPPPPRSPTPDSRPPSVDVEDESPESPNVDV